MSETIHESAIAELKQHLQALELRLAHLELVTNIEHVTQHVSDRLATHIRTLAGAKTLPGKKEE